MAADIHPTAIVEQGADLHPSVRVGPFSIVEAGAVVGAGCVIESNVRIFAPVRMGQHNRVCHGAVLGCEPQDLTFTPERSRPLVIGDHNHFKEGVNISRGVKTEEGTRIGHHNYFMNTFHAGHDCVIGDHNLLGATTVLAGHVTVGNRVFISGLVAIHQFCHVGDHAMIAGCSKVVKDVPPYSTADGNPARIVGLNSVGLRRAGFSAERRHAIKQVYKTLYHSGLNVTQALERLAQEPLTPEQAAVRHFFLASERGITAHR